MSRSESAKTQVDAFANIFKLVTRYPGIRRLFIRFKSMSNSALDDETPEATEKLWEREENFDRNWEFRMRLAAFCISRNELATLLESVRPSELGRGAESGMCFVEKLLTYCCG